MPTRTLLALWILVALTLLPQPVMGQSMSIGVYTPAQAFHPEFDRTDIAIIARLLTLGEPEREALNALHEGYVGALKNRAETIGEDLQDRIERSQAMGDPALARPTDDEVVKWESEAARLKQGFLDDLKSMMTREQTDRWPLAEREMRRFKQIGDGRMYGESIDLARVVERSFQEAWNNPQVIEILATYAAQVDGALKRREAATTPDLRQRFEELATTDRAAAEAIFESARAARIAIRDLNLRTAELLAGEMGEPEGTRLRRQVFGDSFPHLVRPSRSENCIRAIASLDSLTAQQATDVKLIVEQYDQRRWALLAEMAAVLRERQSTRLPAELDPAGSQATVATTADGEKISFWSSSRIKPRNDDPMTALNERRYQLDRETRQRLEAMLTPEQKDAVRQPPAHQITFSFDQGELGL